VPTRRREEEETVPVEEDRCTPWQWQQEGRHVERRLQEGRHVEAEGVVGDRWEKERIVEDSPPRETENMREA